MNRFIAMVTALLLCTASVALATGTSTVPEQECPDVCSPCPEAPACICNPAPCKCDNVQCPDVTCPEIPPAPDCICDCPEYPESPNQAGVYSFAGITASNAWDLPTISTGGFVISTDGKTGYGFMCLNALGNGSGCMVYGLIKWK